jgi:hypothetical protein
MLQRLLAEHRFETARRTGAALVARKETRTADAVFGLHDAHVALAEFFEAQALLGEHADVLRDEAFAVALRLAEDAQGLVRESSYRISAEAKAGLTLDEYQEKYRALANERYATALTGATTGAQRDALRASLKKRGLTFPEGLETEKSAVAPEGKMSGAKGRVSGEIMMPDGSPAAHVTVTLGLPVSVKHANPATYVSWDADYLPVIGPMGKLTAQTDGRGAFCFHDTPEGVMEFLAVTLDADEHAIATRFVERAIVVRAGRETKLGRIIAGEWSSVPSHTWESPLPETRVADGREWKKRAEQRLHNPFYYDFRRQALELKLPDGFDAAREWLRVEIAPGGNGAPGEAVPHQIVNGQVVIMVALPARSDCCVGIYSSAAAGASSPGGYAREASLRLVKSDAGNGRWIIDTGAAQFCISGPDAALDAPPIVAVRGADARWRGRGRFVFPKGVSVVRREVCVEHDGPVMARVRCGHVFNNGAVYTLVLTAYAGEAFLGVREISPALEGAAFEFSLREFSGGRVFRNWTRENPDGGRHWWPLAEEDAVHGEMVESVPWWVPPQCFGCAMTPDGLDERDYIGVFSLRRGEWVDREFERIAQGPVDENGRPNHELDWPHPEMLGSSVSAITAHTGADGDAFFRFGFFDGERQWGLFVSDLEANDGVRKEFSAVQHAYSSPRLQDFKDWHFDVPDALERPHVVAKRGQLIALREKSRSPRFARLWKKIAGGKVRGPGNGLAFAVDGDPLVAWRKRIELVCVAEVRSRMVLLGRDWSDMYSPVLGRPITEWAEEYDLIAASGVFSAEEERTVRDFLVLMGHMYIETDFMNWRFNARNANFEADRTDIVGAVCAVFDGHPDAEKFRAHLLDVTRRSLRVYCTPGSGKWYENPACYYLQAAKCRMNLVHCLVTHGRLRLDEIPMLREFLFWGVHLLLPPHPVSYSVMRDGAKGGKGESGAELFARVEKVRKIAPIGDHATIGRWLPEHYATIGKLFRDTGATEADRAFGRELLDAYFLSNADGKRLLTDHAAPVEQEGEQLFHDIYTSATFGNLPLFFTVIEEADIPPAPALRLESRRLEGFGAMLRHGVDTEHEGCVLLKQGPGGYRYHRTEGGIIFFADGKPLLFDGGEAGEAWRHSTLSFYDVKMPLMAGRLEKVFTATPAFQFTQGSHAGPVPPGEPVWCGDRPSRERIADCLRRYRAPAGVVRSLAWLDGCTLVVHDAITAPPEIPSQWHLQVVGGAPTGDATGGYVFPGRFGVDLQVLFPGQQMDAATVDELPIFEYRGAQTDWFAMQHLEVIARGAREYLAVLQPLSSGGRDRVAAEALRDAAGRITGVRVSGADSMVSRVWFGRDVLTRSRDTEHEFFGTAGGLMLGGGRAVLALMGAGRLAHGEWRLESDGPEVALTITGTDARLDAHGRGEVRVFRGNKGPAAFVNAQARQRIIL